MAFLGIRIPTEVGRMLSAIEVPGIKESPSEYHITILCFDDNWPITDVAKALEATYDIVSKQKPFIVELKNIDSFPKYKDNPIPIIARVDSKELHDLCDKLKSKFDDENIDYRKNFKEFNPHVTLAYDNDLDKFDQFKIDPIVFSVQDIVLWGGDYGDNRLFVNFQLKSPEKRASLLSKIESYYKTAQSNHYKYNSSYVDKFLELFNGDEDAKLEEFNEYGGWTNYYFDLILINDIENKEIWNKEKFDINLQKMKDNISLDPVKIGHTDKGKFNIIDGIHRIAASKELGYTHVPALVSDWVKTPPHQTKLSLFDKINMFYKLAFIDPDGYLTPSHERRKNTH